MPWTPAPAKKRWHQYWTVRIVLSLLVVGVVAGPRLLRRYDRWSARKSLERAQDFLAKGDYQRAALDARRAIQVDPNDPVAIRIVAQTLEAVGSPAAQSWRIRLDALIPGDRENILALAKDALQAGDWVTAERVIKTLKPADQSTAAYHEIVARLAEIGNDAARAESQWAEAARLDPGEDRYRLNLAALRLKSKDDAIRAGALGVLRELGGKGTQVAPALRILLDRMVAGGDASGVKEIADALVAAPGATFKDRLWRLSALRQIEDERAAAYLGELREAAKSTPADLAQLFSWMNSNSLAMLVAESAASLPPEIVSKPPVCLAVAEAYVQAADWKALRAMTEKGNWMELDYLRRVFLARTLERFGEAEAGAAEWKKAVAAAPVGQGASRRMEWLAKTALGFGWDERGEEVLWRLAAYEECPAWVIDTLWKTTFKRRDTVKLQKLSATIAKSSPRDWEALNNYVFLSLLTRTEEGNPRKAAESLYQEHRGNPGIVSTYALSLYQQGKPAEALAALEALKPEELRDPQVAVYYAIMLTATGQAGRAGEYLDLGRQRKLFPEEEALIVKARDDFAEKERLAKPPAPVPDPPSTAPAPASKKAG